MTLPVISETETALLTIFDYIRPRNKALADHLYAAIRHTADSLSLYPYAHGPGRTLGTSDVVVHPNYILICSVAADAIEVLLLIHTRQQYP
ncbi:type II toxin-antitoxin system RelE/ParE family toxin [Sphingobium sp. RAC03]|uniref:type II toxin-antitoxin system RelE/ParE family toxin n=1 Tax=Sphingobium sp. RAC03 TaxID=1843368 RepID=UPI00083E0AD1|nr:type II toxin-antitoxin system RelE/ParE family toxin [Sphingobium sp. RAC03]AOF97417.1 plasmid stabilization system family protein [Sphingobium sp. RAC03]